jgi:hypothetical protein
MGLKSGFLPCLELLILPEKRFLRSTAKGGLTLWSDPRVRMLTALRLDLRRLLDLG